MRNCRSAALSASVLPDVELLDELLFVVEERVEAAEDLALPELVVPEPAVRPEDDLLGGIFNEVSAGHHRQIPDVAGILAHRQILPLF